MFSNPWKDHRCSQGLVPHYEYKNVVEGIHLSSVNQHRGKFPSWVARRPPPIKITIKSHIFHAGVINSRMQLQPFKQTRRQRQTTSHLLIIRSREWKHFPAPCQPILIPTIFPWLWASSSTTAAKAALRGVTLYQDTLPQPKQALSTCIFKCLGCPHDNKAIRWATSKKTGSLLELN